jgi:hypothetical protein
VAFRQLEGRKRVAMRWLTTSLLPRYYLVTSSLHMALGWLWGAYPLAINTLWSGFDVALGGFGWGPTVRSWMLDVRCWMFIISLPNPTPLPRLPRGGLGAPWTNPGHVLVP